jgi:hypothetical protein
MTTSDVWAEQRVLIKFYIELGKTPGETIDHHHHHFNNNNNNNNYYYYFIFIITRVVEKIRALQLLS